MAAGIDCLMMTTRRKPQNYFVCPVPAADHVFGPTSAPVILLEYGCYGCPRERQMLAGIRRLKRLFGDRIAFVFRHYPLTALYPSAFLAAEAAEAAAAQGHFWRMHNYLVDHSCSYSQQDLVQIA